MDVLFSSLHLNNQSLVFVVKRVSGFRIKVCSQSQVARSPEGIYPRGLDSLRWGFDWISAVSSSGSVPSTITEARKVI